MNKILGQRIKELRIKNNLTQAELAKKLLKAESSIRMWELNKSQPDSYTLKKLSRIFNISTDYLLGNINSTLAFTEADPEKTDMEPIDDLPIKNAFKMPEQIKLPILGVVSAGNGLLAEENIIGYASCDSKYSINDHFCLIVKGDSMSPKLDDGDLVVIKKQSSVDNGSFAVVLVDDEEGIIKKVIYDKNFIELHSINPYYPVRRFENEDVLRVRVVGLALEAKRQL